MHRYITVLYFLNNVEEGGETAFPVADEENFNETVKNIFLIDCITRSLLLYFMTIRIVINNRLIL